MQINTKRKLSLLTAVQLLFFTLAPLIAVMPKASAAALTWDGGGVDNNFSTAENWSGDVVPQDGDSLVFDMSILTENETLNNDISGLVVAGISRIGTGDVLDQFTYTIDGEGVTLTGPIVGADDDEWGQLRLKIDITLGANVGFSGMRSVYLDPPGVFDLGTFNLTLDGSYNSITNIKGSGDISVEGGDTSIYGTATGYTGNVFLSDGNLSVGLDSVGADSSITVSDTGKLAISSSGNFPTELILGGDGGPCWSADCSLEIYDYNNEGINFIGGLTLESDVVVTVYGNLAVEEPFTSNSFSMGLTPASTGTISLPDDETIENEPTNVTIASGDESGDSVTAWYQQTVILNGERGSAYIYEGGTLKGTGTLIGSVNVATGGTLAPGLSPGCLTMGGLTISGTFEVEIAGTEECDDYDQTVVNGTVNVSGAVLDISFLNDFIPEVEDEFIIINNDGSDAVTGTFDGLAEGDEVEIDGVTFAISYEGGSGNDVVLTVTDLDAGLTATAVDEEDEENAPGVPDTGLASMLVNPLLPIIVTSLTASVFVINRRLNSKNK